MGNENQTLDKTYTSSQNSLFNDDGVDLHILLPEKAVDNPYIFKAFDISQIVNGQQQNALFIYMKRETDDASDLSKDDDDTCECNFACGYGDLTIIDSFATSTGFDPTADDTLVIVYHDASDDKVYQQACAEAVFVNVATIVTDVANIGNFQTELNLGGYPRKTGASFIPRR